MGKKEEELFASIETMGNRIAEAGVVFATLVKDLDQAELLANRMHDIEHAADNVLKGILASQLPAMSQLPFGLEHNEITTLVRLSDDIVDSLWQAANQIGIVYQLKDKDSELDEIAELLLEATQHIQGLFINFKRFDRQRNLPQVRQSVHKIESRADELKDIIIRRRYLEASQGLEYKLRFDAWKEVYDWLEETTDICEDIIDLFCDFHQKYCS